MQVISLLRFVALRLDETSVGVSFCEVCNDRCLGLSSSLLAMMIWIVHLHDLTKCSLLWMQVISLLCFVALQLNETSVGASFCEVCNDRCLGLSLSLLAMMIYDSSLA